MTTLVVLWGQLLQLAKRIPAGWWGYGVLLVLCGAAWFGRVRYGAAEYARGRADVLKEARVDSALTAHLRAMVDASRARTDSQVTTVRRATRAVREAIPQPTEVPPALAPFVAACTTLVVASDSLTRVLDQERVLAAAERDAADGERKALRLVQIAQRDTIADLRKRPTRLAAGLAAIGGVALGALLVIIR